MQALRVVVWVVLLPPVGRVPASAHLHLLQPQGQELVAAMGPCQLQGQQLAATVPAVVAAVVAMRVAVHLPAWAWVP